MSLATFPSRVRFINADGTLTPEAYRFLVTVYDRVGGQLGDTGLDTFTLPEPFDTSGSVGLGAEPVFQNAPADFFADMALQMPQADYLPEVTQQSASDSGHMAEMVFQAQIDGSPIRAVTVGASPFAFTAAAAGSVSVQGGAVSAVSFKRNATTVTLGLTAGLVPVNTGDVVTVTYSVLPTLNFIPR